MISNKFNVNNDFLSYIYIISYIISLFAFFAAATLINGNPLYVTAPTYDVTINNICDLFMFVSVVINVVLFILCNTYVSKINFKRIVIFYFILFIYAFSIIFHYPIMPPICLITYLLILNSFLINSNSFIEIDFILKLFFIFSIIILYFLHFFPSNNIPTILRNGTSIRACLGFSYPTTLASAILGLLLSFILVYRYYVRNIFAITLILIVGLYFYFITDSRSLLVSILSLTFLLFLIKVRKIRYFIVKYLPLFLIISLFISIGAILYYKYSLPFSEELNSMLSDRLSDQLAAITNFHINLFGHILPSANATTPINVLHMTAIDNVFIGLLIEFGIIGTTIYESFFIISGYKASKSEDVILCVVLFVLSIQFLVEADFDKIWMIAPLIYSFSNYSNSRDQKSIKN